jgi:hypothetical protein
MIKLTVSLMLAAMLAACGGNNPAGSSSGPHTLNPPSNQLVDVQPEVDATGKTITNKVVTVTHQ